MESQKSPADLGEAGAAETPSASEKPASSGARGELNTEAWMTSIPDTSLTEAIRDAALDALVCINVRVAQVTLTGREWAALAPGDVLKTDAPVGAEVELVVNGGTVAYGDLVKVNGNVGVRITRR